LQISSHAAPFVVQACIDPFGIHYKMSLSSTVEQQNQLDKPLPIERQSKTLVNFYLRCSGLTEEVGISFLRRRTQGDFNP